MRVRCTIAPREFASRSRGSSRLDGLEGISGPLVVTRNGGSPINKFVGGIRKEARVSWGH